MTAKAKRAGIIGGLIFIGLGIAAIINPDLMEGAEASGRHFLAKLIFIYLWSRPGGIVAILLGCCSIWGVIKPQEEEKNEATIDKNQKPDLRTVSIDETETPNANENDGAKYAPPGYFDK